MASESETKEPLPDRITIFVFLWACQALVHQEFYSAWVDNNNPRGWILTACALATLLKPTSIALFATMLFSSVLYNFMKWPMVVNHILVESVINMTILAALAVSFVRFRQGKIPQHAIGNQSFDRFAPVVKVMLVVVYYFAFLSKLNWGFVNPDVSCVVVMYGDLVNRFPFLPVNETAYWIVIWATLIVEAAIPLLLTFRVTRYWGVLIGVPFHIVLGLVGHRTFSALAFALYALFCMDEFVLLARLVYRRLRDRVGDRWLRAASSAARIVAVVVTGSMIAADFTGNYEVGIGPLTVFRLAWMIWILWSMIMACAFAAAAWICYRSKADGEKRHSPTAHPGWLWLVVLVVVFNGLTQYLGFKTETCFTMYSNLRTEAQFNNHFFMPAFRLGAFQTDLVEVEETTLEPLKHFEESGERITYFELRRVVSSTEQDFLLTYMRNGERHEVARQNGVASASELFEPHGFWIGKLLFFRPVSMEECAVCQH